jgi:hypothetical protein
MQEINRSQEQQMEGLSVMDTQNLVLLGNHGGTVVWKREFKSKEEAPVFAFTRFFCLG